MTKQTPYQLMHLKATRSVIRQHEESLLGRTTKDNGEGHGAGELRQDPEEVVSILPVKSNDDDGYKELFKILVGNDEE